MDDLEFGRSVRSNGLDTNQWGFGVDEQKGLVAMLLLSTQGRLTELRFSPADAENLGNALLKYSAKVSRPAVVN